MFSAFILVLFVILFSLVCSARLFTKLLKFHSVVWLVSFNDLLAVISVSVVVLVPIFV